VGNFKSSANCFFLSLKISLFYKIHLQAFNVISIMLYHSGPTFGKVLYSCLDAFVVDASDYSGHLIRHILNASEAFPTEWFLQFWEQVEVWWVQSTRLRLFSKFEDTTPWETLLLGNRSKSGGLSPTDFDLFPNLKIPLRGKRFRSIEEVFNEVTWVIRCFKNEGARTGVQDLPKRWTTEIKHNGDYIEGM
jgi:hypothetical protein